jgi:hypothetical protein
MKLMSALVLGLLLYMPVSGFAAGDPCLNLYTSDFAQIQFMFDNDFDKTLQEGSIYDGYASGQKVATITFGRPTPAGVVQVFLSNGLFQAGPIIANACDQADHIVLVFGNERITLKNAGKNLTATGYSADHVMSLVPRAMK